MANFHAGPPPELRTQGSLLTVLEAHTLERKNLARFGERQSGDTLSKSESSFAPSSAPSNLKVKVYKAYCYVII